jgi:hypothetical protein
MHALESQSIDWKNPIFPGFEINPQAFGRPLGAFKLLALVYFAAVKGDLPCDRQALYCGGFPLRRFWPLPP